MLSERAQRQVDHMLDEAEAAIRLLDWATVRDRAQAVLALDRENVDAAAYLAAADHALAQEPGVASRRPAAPLIPSPVAEEGSGAGASPTPLSPGAVRRPREGPTNREDAQRLPDSFVRGRYSVLRFLGEGGKKRVYLTHDAQLDRDVAFALLKTDGLDADSLTRLRREAQAMGRLGDHPHIVTVHDIGEENGQPYLVCQFMAGGSIEDLLQNTGDHRLPLDQTLDIADCHSGLHPGSPLQIHAQDRWGHGPGPPALRTQDSALGRQAWRFRTRAQFGPLPTHSGRHDGRHRRLYGPRTSHRHPALAPLRPLRTRLHALRDGLRTPTLRGR